MVWIAEAVQNSLTIASVYAFPAKNAFAIFHRTFLHHLFNFQAHWTILGTSMTVDTGRGFNCQMQGWNPYNITDLGADDHKRRNPADIVSEGFSTSRH